jgi:hypothetical protein
MKLTAQIKLIPTPEQADLLKQTLEAANAACKAICRNCLEHLARCLAASCPAITLLNVPTISKLAL